METKQVEIGNPVKVAQITLIPVVEVSLNSWSVKKRCSCFGTKQPISLVVVSPSGKRAFRITGEEIPLDKLLDEKPGIIEALESI